MTNGEVQITGHADEWVALRNNKVVLSNTTFTKLVKQIQDKKLTNQVTVTHVSGNLVIL